MGETPNEAERSSELFARCRSLLEATDLAGNSSACMEMCRQMLRLVDRDNEPVLWAWLHSKLASLLLRDSPLAPWAENMEQAIKHLQQALEVFTLRAFPREWARIQITLGEAFERRIRGDIADNSKQAGKHYAQAQEVFTEQDFLEEWEKISAFVVERPKSGGVRAKPGGVKAKPGRVRAEPIDAKPEPSPAPPKVAGGPNEGRHQPTGRRHQPPGGRPRPAGVSNRSKSRSTEATALAAGAESLRDEGQEVIRYGHLGFPARVQLQQPQTLRITINRQLVQNEEGQVALHLFARQWPMKVVATLVNVQPEDFLVEGAISGVIEVPKDRDSEPLVFMLVPQSLGPKTIRVRFEQDNAFLTTAPIHTEVTEQAPAEAGQATVESAPALEPRGLPPDFTLYIERDAERTYSVSVCTGDSDPSVPAQRVGALTFEQEGSPGRYMQTRFEELNATVSSGAAAERYADAVERLGNNLYEKLFIRGGLDSFYWEQMYPRSKQQAAAAQEGSAPTVQIVSDEPYIPWELLRPFRRSGQGIEVDSLFFCERFALARWLDVPHGASAVDLFKVALVVPPSNLAFVQEEVEAFERMEREDRLKVERIESKEALDTFLAQRGAQVVHFACHGRFEQEQPGRSLVALGSNAYLRPDDVTGKYLAFGRSRPLVFLNACDTARQGFGLTGLEGWAETFVRTAGVGGFIGSTWQTTDARACRFAISFYELLSKGFSLGEAMRRARMDIKSPGDATYLSYTLFANPRARVRRAAV